MRVNKSLAAGLTTALVASAISTIGLAAPAQAYGPAAESLGCRVYFGDVGTGDLVTTYNDTFTLTASPATAATGATVTVTFTAAEGLTNGPVPQGAGTKAISATIDVTGTATDLTLATQTPATYPPAPVPGSGKFGGYSVSGTYVMPDSAVTIFALKQLRFNDSSGSNADTYCTDADAAFAGGVDPKAAPVVSTVITAQVNQPAATVATSTGQAAGAQIIARNAGSTPAARQVTLTGTNFSPNVAAGAGSVQICDTNGTTNCTSTGISENLTTDAQGAISGPIDIASGTTLVTGNRAIVVTGYSTNPVLVPVRVLTAPQVVLTPSIGKTGTVVTVAGNNFNAGQANTSVFGSTSIIAASAPDDTDDAAVTVATNNEGVFTTTYTVTDPDTASIRVIQNGPILGPPSVSQATGFGLFTVDNTAPAGTASVPATAETGKPVTLTLSPTDNASPANTIVAKVTWGDGSAVQTLAAGATSATHTYATAGNYTVTVTYTDQAGNTSAPITAGTVAVSKAAVTDTTDPVVDLTRPGTKRALQADKWLKIKGTIVDADSGPKWVKIKLVSKSTSNEWRYFTGTKWKNTTSKKMALKKAKYIADNTVGGGVWKITLKKKPVLGKLFVQYTGSDVAGNESTPRRIAQKITQQ